MKREALEAARVEFNRARDSVEAHGQLSPVADFEGIQTRWVAFLSAAVRFFNKLSAGSKTSPQSKQWYDNKIIQRRNDPLLWYIWQAPMLMSIPSLP
jgi:hypothetical protein